MTLVRFRLVQASGPPLHNSIYCDMGRDFKPDQGEMFNMSGVMLQMGRVIHQDSRGGQPKYEVHIPTDQATIDKAKADGDYNWMAD